MMTSFIEDEDGGNKTEHSVTLFGYVWMLLDYLDSFGCLKIVISFECVLIITSFVMVYFN